jgi:hypothetical protein
MAGSLNMGGNQITNVGNVDGVDVSSHASRHAPGASDPLSTGTPIAISIGASADAGDATSLSRSNHQHGIPTATPVAVGTANNVGDADSVSRSNHVHAGLTRSAADFNTFTEKTTPVGNDLFLIEDSADSNNKKKIKISNLPAAAPAAHATTHKNGGGDEVATATASADAIPKANASAKLDIGWLPTGSTSTTVCIGDDSRLSNSRAPNGSASGDLAGSYPGPTVAQASQAFALTGVISPASIGADQNDYNPTSLAIASRLRLTSSGAYNITGLAGGALGRILTIFNVGSFNLTFTNEDAGSTAANRFNFSGSGNVVLTPHKAILVQYDNTSQRWRCISAADP